MPFARVMIGLVPAIRCLNNGLLPGSGYAERGYIDDVIMPYATRKRIARALAMLRNKHVEAP